MSRLDYWRECVACSLDEHGVQATDEQIKAVAADIEVAHDNYGLAHYTPPAGEHLRAELAETKRKLEAERRKVHCEECGGHGRITYAGPYHSANTECWKCRGEGRHA